jgi:hypothetical protein
LALVTDKGDNHGVQVPEEQEEVEAELDEGLLLVGVELTEDLRRVEQVVLLIDPTPRVSSDESWFIAIVLDARMRLADEAEDSQSRRKGVFATHFFAFHANSGMLSRRVTQYPLIRKRNVKKACRPASGTMYMFKRLHKSIGLM